MKKIILLLLILFLVNCTGGVSGFKVDHFTDYRQTRIIHKNIDVYYLTERINKIKKNEKYIILGTISGRNEYGSPWYDKIFNERLRDACNWMGGNILLYKIKSSKPKENFHMYEVLKKKDK